MIHSVQCRCSSHLWAVAVCFSAFRTAAAQVSPAVIEYSNPTSVRMLPQNALTLHLGSAGSVEFHQIAAILPHGNGTFVVVNAGSSELRFFDVSGHLLTTVGRRGPGPGEYARIQEAGFLPGDSIAVYDPGARRVSILNPDGIFVRSFPLKAPWDSGGSATHMVPLSDGTVLVGYSEIIRMAPQPTPVYIGQRLFRYSTSGELRSPNGLRLPMSEHFVQAVPPQSMGNVAYWNLAFGRTMTLRADSSGLLVGDGTDRTIEQRAITGAVLRTHHLRRSASPVTARDKDAYRESTLAGSKGDRLPVDERLVAEMPYPKTKPAYRRFESDGAGRLWVEAYPETGQTQAIWIRLDPRTRTAVAVALPPRFRPLAFTAALVYGVWRDSDDVEHVQIFGLDGSVSCPIHAP